MFRLRECMVKLLRGRREAKSMLRDRNWRQAEKSSLKAMRLSYGRDSGVGSRGQPEDKLAELVGSVQKTAPT
jgi:hypothetical protein